MARPRKPRTEPEPETEAAKPSETRQVISKQKLRALLKSARTTQDDVNEISGRLGTEIKLAVEKHYLNRKIFNFIKSLDRLENEKIAMHLEDLEHYLDISGLNERAAKVQSMPLGGGEDEEGEGEGEGEAEEMGGPRGRTVRPFPRPIGEAAE